MIPKQMIAHLPTPVEWMPRLSAALGGPKLLVKRDDQTGLAMGGNKTRKLEYILADAQAQGAKTLVTIGAVQSNHCRQTAALAARFGFDCILILYGDKPETMTGNLLLDALFGAEIHWTTREQRDETFNRVFNHAWQEGRRPYAIPLGASNALGAVAYAEAFSEMIDQGVNPDWIIFASSSAGTQAGMVLGARRTEFRGKILGISVDLPRDDLAKKVAALATAGAERYGEKHVFNPQDILVNDRYIGAGYAVLGENETRAIQLFAKYEGLLVDPVYTGRAAGAMIDLIEKQFFKPDETVLFWHTGGTPALFAQKYMDAFQEIV
ncbi:MAG TPA: D-cysteine desulfhydrase family protein [Anaerolineaceae bacterium]